MTRDDIIRMAREAGINVEQGFLLRFAGVEDDLERFAALVAAAEREALCRWIEAEFASYDRADAVVAVILARGKK